MSAEILIFLTTGVFSGLVGLTGLFYVSRIVWSESRRISVGIFIASLYFCWLAIVYMRVVLGLETPTGYSVLVRPLFNTLLIGMSLIFTGIVVYIKFIKRRGK